MSKNNQNKLIPTLRFPEFTKDEEWQSNRLGNVYAFITTNSFSRDDLSYVNGNVKNIHYGDIHTKFSTLFDITKENVPFINESIPLDKFKKENYCKESDMIFADASEDLKDVGKSIEVVNLNNEKLLSGLHTLLARQINSEFVSGFGGYLFLNDGVRKQIQRESQGAKVLGISATRLSNINIFYPKEKKEQQKISACLSSLDEVMTAESQKLEMLKDHKKSLLQNLLPQEGETVPKFRFKEFEVTGDWEEMTLDSLTTKISDGIHTTPNYEDDGKYYFINGNNLIDGKIWIDEKTKRVSEEEYNKHKRDLSESTILLSINGTIGNIAVYRNEKVILGKSACYINVDESKVDKTFIIYFIQTDAIKNYFDFELTGSTIKNLSLKSIKETIIKIPIKPKEQEKIADTLSSIDDLINAQGQKLETLQLHKKGLLQGLFPKLNDATV